MKYYQNIKDFLVKQIKHEVSKRKFDKVIVAISGGIDSAVVATLAKKAFHDNLYGVFMPTKNSSKQSLKDAKKLCEKFNIAYEIINIDSFANEYLENIHDKLRIGNFHARIRMSVLYDLSSKYNALVLGTSNKTELILGYGTIFGDLASAVNPLGDLYKTEVINLAKYLNIPKSIISKPPSADLWKNQSDEEDLGFTYKKIDEFLINKYDKKLDDKTLCKLHDTNLIQMVKQRKNKNSFKLKMPKIIKIKLKEKR